MSSCWHPVAAVDDLTAVRTSRASPTLCSAPSMQLARAAAPGADRSAAHLPRCVGREEAASVAGVVGPAEVADPLPGAIGRPRGGLSLLRHRRRGAVHRQPDALGRRQDSRLSPYLHFGCLSPRECRSACRGTGSRRLPSPPAGALLYARLLHFPGTPARSPGRYRAAHLSYSRASTPGPGRTGTRGGRGQRQLLREGGFTTGPVGVLLLPDQDLEDRLSLGERCSCFC